MRSLTKYNNLVIIDLSSYGSALAIINQFADDKDVKVFEVSPLGQAALLVLMTHEQMAATLLKEQIISHWAAAVIQISVITNAHENLLKTYLSQNQSLPQKNILVLESNSVAVSLVAANQLLKENMNVLDLRVVRTYPANCILCVTAEKSEPLFIFSSKNKHLRSTLIENVEPTLKSYFEIISH